jgi:hypothetical protein
MTTAPLDGFVKSWPLRLLRLEGTTLFASTIYAYSRLGLSWYTFGAGLLLPDLGMIGFLKDSVLGSALYNAVHTETPAIVMLVVAFARGDRRLGGWALIWLSHIGMDRMIGAGLKYGTGFGHTHLGVMGKN